MIRWVALLLFLQSLFSGIVLSAAQDCKSLISQSSAQLEAMQRHALEFERSLQQLNAALARAEQRNVEQTLQIERLQQELQRARLQGEELANRHRREFFASLGQLLPASTLYQVVSDHLVIANDPVYVFRKGELGQEGRDRLRPMVQVLLDLIHELDEAVSWRLRIEGHSDSRPVRSSSKFSSNWELSAARAVSMLDYLVDEGLPEDRLSAVGMADTAIRDPGSNSAAHRRNRRIEIHLEFSESDA